MFFGLLNSEPPDIRNWLSSYMYESSTFDTCSLVSSEEVSQGNKCVDERLDFEVLNKGEGRSKNVQPKVSVQHNSTFDKNMEGDGSAGMKKILTIDNILNPEKILQPCMQDKALRHTHDSTKYKKIVNCNHGSPVCNEEARLTSLDTDTDTSARRPTKLVQ